MTRVVVLTTYFHPTIGGVESNAARLAGFLQRAGLSVTVLTKRLSNDLPDCDERDGVPVRRIGPFGDRSSVGKWLVVPAVLRWLIGHASEYDVVCCIDYRGIGFAALAARALTGRPVVVQAQTTGVLSAENAGEALTRWRVGFIRGLIQRAIRGVYRRADAFACISREIEREAIACGVSAERIHYLPNAVDMAHFHPANDDERERLRRTLHLEPDAVVCVFVGRLSREKGIMDLMTAWRLLQPSAAVLVVAGPDMIGHPWDVGPAARAFAQAYLPSVRFLGPITDAAPVLRAADLAAVPSHFEALGLSAIEALACGVPVVASSVGGLLDFVVDGQNGRLSPPQDAAALAKCLRPLLADPALRAALAANARSSIAAEFNQEIVFARFGEVLTRASQTGGGT